MGKKGGSARSKNNSQRQGQSNSERDSGASARDSGASARNSNPQRNVKKQQSWVPVSNSPEKVDDKPVTEPVVSNAAKEDPPTQAHQEQLPFSFGTDKSASQSYDPSTSPANGTTKQTMQEKLEHRRQLVEGDGGRPSQVGQAGKSKTSALAEQKARQEAEREAEEAQKKAEEEEKTAKEAERQAVEAQKKAADAQRKAEEERKKAEEERIKAEQANQIKLQTPVSKPSTYQTEPEEEARPERDTIQQHSFGTATDLHPQSESAAARGRFPCGRGLQCFRALFGGR